MRPNDLSNTRPKWNAASKCIRFQLYQRIGFSFFMDWWTLRSVELIRLDWFDREMLMKLSRVSINPFTTIVLFKPRVIIALINARHNASKPRAGWRYRFVVLMEIT